MKFAKASTLTQSLMIMISHVFLVIVLVTILHVLGCFLERCLGFGRFLAPSVCKYKRVLYIYTNANTTIKIPYNVSLVFRSVC
jgi:hypothetical protein